MVHTFFHTFHQPSVLSTQVTCLAKTDNAEHLKKCVILTDEATFYVNGFVNWHRCRIWEFQQPSETT